MLVSHTLALQPEVVEAMCPPAPARAEEPFDPPVGPRRLPAPTIWAMGRRERARPAAGRRQAAHCRQTPQDQGFSAAKIAVVKAGRSAGTREVMIGPSTTTGSSTQVAPAFLTSSLTA